MLDVLKSIAVGLFAVSILLSPIAVVIGVLVIIPGGAVYVFVGAALAALAAWMLYDIGSDIRRDRNDW